MKAPSYQAPPKDPTLVALDAKASADDTAAIQNTAQIDTAALMARYGTRLAMAGSTSGAPATSAAAPGASGWMAPLVNPVLQRAGKI
jgi:hypothetical protein